MLSGKWNNGSHMSKWKQKEIIDFILNFLFVNSGQFRHNKYHGEGELHYPDASIYKGEFDRGHRYGHGTYTQPGGYSYDGQWMNDMKDGRGKMEYANGDVYDGTWVNDVVSLCLFICFFCLSFFLSWK